MSKSIDLNADLGEHYGSKTDEHIMPFISSCNIACGGHFGDINSIMSTLKLAKKWKVAVGAHPSYPDKENFGRRKMEIRDEELSKSIQSQLQLFKYCCNTLNIQVKHVKPHGALYNEIATDRSLGEVVCKSIHEVFPDTNVFGLAGSEVSEACSQFGLTFIPEAFADRSYRYDGTLMPRSLSKAVLNEKESVNQALEIVLRQRVKADSWISIKAKSLCLHGDSRGAVQMAKHIYDQLKAHGIAITPY